MGLLSSVKQNVRIWVKAILPESAIQALRRTSRRLTSPSRRVDRDSLPPILVEDLVMDLKKAGIEPGDVVMVHSSLSRIGNVAGGAPTVIESLQQAVTSEGTVMMPCYNSADEAFRRSKKNDPLDLRTAPSAVGKITEVFRTSEGVMRSSHPFSSACAWGKNAEYLTSQHAAHPNVCHASSPVGRLVELKGKVLGIGIPIAQGLGVAHYLEDTWDGFPFEVHSDTVTVTYIDAEGTEVTREVSRYDPKVARTRVDYPDGQWICEKLTEHMIRVGVMNVFKFGQADLWIMEAPKLYQEMKRLARKNVTMYLTEDKLADENRDITTW
ncbi:MAG: AAC(3) family N-acetyltransferase [Candidatus Zixiibacteriota bacterium]|nr:MAG: AAC(3) family N-acetyltransferase [candidate division Zixibacteria bacterium]